MTAETLAHDNLVPSRRLLSIAETAQVLNHSQRKVRRLIEKGQIPHISFGRRKLIHPDDLDAFIAKHRRSRPLVSSNGQ